MNTFLAELTTKGIHLGGSGARVKIKGIYRGPDKPWRMLFNSKAPEGPYQGLETNLPRRDSLGCLRGKLRQVVHGCRQLVS